MKTINYLIIAAVILLCSCKGSSFLQQRYTHFAHGASQKQVAQKTSAPALKTTKTSAELVQENAVAQAEKTEALPSSAAAEPAKLVADAGHHIKPFSHRAVKSLLSAPVEKAQAEFNKAKEQTKTAQIHRGLISGLLGLILYIILCAVVIAAIIILVLLII